MALLVADENFPMPAVLALRLAGHDVQTLLDLNQAGLAVPDDEVLSLATSLGRVLLTLNRKDFIKLHSLHPDHAGIIVCKADADFRGLVSHTRERLLAGQSQHTWAVITCSAASCVNI